MLNQVSFRYFKTGPETIQHEDTQAEVFSDFEYLLERGVNAQFAIRTLKASSDNMWYPRRAELEAAGVLTEGL